MRRSIRLLGLADWQLAALIVVLVVVPGAVQQFEARHGRNTAAVTGAAPTVAPSPSRAGRLSHVRPPRSC